MRLDEVDTQAETAFEAVGMHERVRVRQREHAPVELAAEVGAFGKREVTEHDVARQRLFLETVQLEVIDAHVVVLAQADVELHAPLVDLVVEAEIILAAERAAFDAHGRVEPQQGGHGSREIGAAHVEVIGERARDLERLRLQCLAGLELGLGAGLLRTVVDRLILVGAHDGAPGIQQAQRDDQRESHSRLQRTGKQAWP
jgi:hypothetical protein